MTMGMLVLAAATALTLLQPLVAGRILDRTGASVAVLPLASLLMTMLIGQLLLESLGHFQLDKTGEHIVLDLRTEFTNHVVRLPIGVLDLGRAGDLLARGTSDATLLRDMPRAVADVTFGLLTLMGAVILMLAIDPVTVGVVVVVMGLAFIAGNPLLSRIQRASLQRQDALGDYTAGLDRALGAARTVKLFGAEQREATSIGRSARAACDSGIRIALATAIDIGIIRLGITGSFLAIMIMGGRRVADGHLTLGAFVTLFAFAVYTIFPVNAAFTALAALRTSAGGYQHLLATLQELPEDDAPARSTADHIVARAVAPDGQHLPLVEFDQVSFAYGDNRVLDNVSFALCRDQITALIGASGAGKSTILALLCRFHDPSTGTVRWNGRDVRDIPLRELRGQLGLLEQDAPALHGTIRDNLLIADPDADDEELWRVLEQANLAGEIRRLPEGLGTAVSERGRSLSGGQRQRLALARAYLSRSQLILMDEPTSHLDRANEYDVMKNLLQARGQRSLLVVAHRLSTVTNADQILVLSDGRIQATGTHIELLHAPVYRDLIECELTRD
ncbi:ABC transporter ATP-binding protein [Mycolicibacterium sp. CBMA 226]|uniref:ABC transporter ATP-binding protein n=1 Tax=Mycolicibacterium sp. CBMA 226 TaxID=2606611 RepID=UPI001412C342|nr:ABC transporter ATP-binding protein [Mycolicibacterium sp. CBMA 226]